MISTTTPTEKEHIRETPIEQLSELGYLAWRRSLVQDSAPTKVAEDEEDEP